MTVAKHFENSQLALNLAERGLGALDARTLGQENSEKFLLYSIFFSDFCPKVLK